MLADSPSAVRAEEAEDLAALDGEGDAVDGGERPAPGGRERLHEVGDLDGCLGAHALRIAPLLSGAHRKRR